MIRRILYILLCSTILWAQDEIIDQGSVGFQFFAEILDAEVYPDNPDIVYVLGVGGFLLMDVSDISNPFLVGRYDPGSIWERYYNGAARGNLAIAAAREDGLDFLDLSNLTQPALRIRYQHSNYSYEGIEFSGNYAYAAAHGDGLEVIDISDPNAPAHVRTITSSDNAWDVFIDGGNLFVADGLSGLKIYSLAQADNPQLIGALPTSGYSKEVTVVNQLAYVAVGSSGFDIIDVSQPAVPALLSNYATQFGITNHLAVDGDAVFTANWDLVEAVDVSDPTRPVLMATEDTPTRAMGIAALNGRVFVTDWWFFRTFTFQPALTPDIQLRPTVHDFGFRGVGVPIDQQIQVHNMGETPLQITNINSTNFRFSVQPTALTVPPGSMSEVTATFIPTGIGTSFGLLQFISNDPDEGQKNMSVFGGESRLSPGDSAISFTLAGLDGNIHSLEDYRGKIVILAFFASW